MPGMDGWELAGRLRADPRHRELLMVALTGWGQPATASASRPRGYHFLKPLEIGPLGAAVRTWRAAKAAP